LPENLKATSFEHLIYSASDMTSQLTRCLGFTTLLVLASASSSNAVSMLHTTNWNALDNTNPYVAEGANWDSVGFINWTSTAPGASSYSGTGTLVPSAVPGQFKFLTAAHNVDSENGIGGTTPNGIMDALNFTIYFGANTGEDGSTAAATVVVPAANISVHPFWQNGDGAGLTASSAQYDLAVMTFSLANVTGVLPSTLAVSTIAPAPGVEGTMVGYGQWGNGQTFAGQPSAGLRRAGKNIIDVVGTTADFPANQGITLQTDFDGPGGVGNTTGTNVALALESSTAGGDSGGPLIAGGMIVGVLNGGFPGTGAPLSQYGDRSVWAPLSTASNINFLTTAGVSLAAVPEPSRVCLLGLSLAAFAMRRRRAVPVEA
jgi:hypothetical protein